MNNKQTARKTIVMMRGVTPGIQKMSQRTSKTGN